MLRQVNQRDNRRCLYTKEGEIEDLCYIFNPSGSRYSWQTKSLSQDFVRLKQILPQGGADSLKSLLLRSKQSTYKAWNILTLSETIRVLWRSTNLAIIWVGSEPDRDSGADTEGNPFKTFAFFSCTG